MDKLLRAIIFDGKSRGWKGKKLQKVYIVDGIPNIWIMRIGILQFDILQKKKGNVSKNS